MCRSAYFFLLLASDFSRNLAFLKQKKRQRVFTTTIRTIFFVLRVVDGLCSHDGQGGGSLCFRLLISSSGWERPLSSGGAGAELQHGDGGAGREGDYLEGSRRR